MAAPLDRLMTVLRYFVLIFELQTYKHKYNTHATRAVVHIVTNGGGGGGGYNIINRVGSIRSLRQTVIQLYVFIMLFKLTRDSCSATRKYISWSAICVFLFCILPFIRHFICYCSLLLSSYNLH